MEPWVYLGLGLVTAPIFALTPLLGFMGWFLASLVHEMGHVLMGIDLAMLSLFGIVALSGVVVNDALVLVRAAYRIDRVYHSDIDWQSLIEAGCRALFPSEKLSIFGLVDVFAHYRELRGIRPYRHPAHPGL